jgi:hypothetical protein|tara:strand:+ start:1583 stop:2449 length:867 start_codon:yes stop_codon:yes gene_type:complete
MTEVVRGDTGMAEDGGFNSYLEDQAQEFGEDDLDIDAVLEGTQVQDPNQSSQEGTDTVLARLDESDPAAAQAVRGMQRRMSQNNNEWHELRSEVLNLREQMISTREENTAQPVAHQEEEPLPEGVTEQNMEIFKAMADRLGYLPREELVQREESRAQEQSAESAVNSDLQAGVDMYGEQFGSMDGAGNFTLNPSIQRRLDSRMQALQDPSRGVTPLDLFRMEFPEAGGARRTSALRGNSPNIENRPSPNVVRRSGASTPGAGVDIRAGQASPEDVLERAWALARRELT